MVKRIIEDDEFEQALAEKQQRELLAAINRLASLPVDQKVHNKDMEILMNRHQAILEQLITAVKSQKDPTINSKMDALASLYKMLSDEFQQIKKTLEKPKQWHFSIKRNSSGYIDSVEATEKK